MSDVEVTREHRLEALRATDWDVDSSECVALSWLDVGGDTHTVGRAQAGGYILNLEEENAIALALATAEHRVRAAVIAALESLCDGSHLMNGDHGPEYVYADSIRNLIDDLRSDNG